MIVRKVQRLHHSLIITLPKLLTTTVGIVRGDYVTLQVVNIADGKVITLSKMKNAGKLIGEIGKENGE